METLGARLRAATHAQTLVIISDETVDALYGDNTAALLARAGYRVLRFSFPAGEHTKTMETVTAILEFLAENAVTRSDALVALGGGIAGDVAGFCAATYQRGMDFVQVPTTLLAAVDSSVGGKTGVNLPAGKNLAGAFWQPRLVLCDTALLDTLPATLYADGMAEVIKYAVLQDADMFRLLGEGTLGQEAMIARCVAIKAAYVRADERDRGERRKLNLGHTFGHAIERASGYSLSHGRAVAIGMVMAARAAQYLGIARRPCTNAIAAALAANGLPVQTNLAAPQLLSAMGRDKKRAHNRITLVLPVEIGACTLLEAGMEQLPDILAAALERG
ncbi:MAG: 3-dehydroquinate synthase [Ruminococcaceae bacterium]|nr:3-dehydroquinate synthase [Oscillospiraceae bacterium]